MGRVFLDSLVAHCRTDAGYTTLKNVVTKEKGDLMPSYFFAETLKYLYLIFAPDSVLDFRRVIFTTEAHPLPMGSDPSPRPARTTRWHRRRDRAAIADRQRGLTPHARTCWESWRTDEAS